MALVELLIFCVAASALVQVRRLRRDLDKLAARLAVAPPPPSAAPLPGAAPAPRPPGESAEPSGVGGTAGAVPGDDVRATNPPPSGSGDIPAATPPADRPGPRAPRPSIEERLGARWSVWVGGVALGLGGLFLVRYSIEQGLVGPGVRVVLGLLFALGLTAAGEALRRRERAGAAARSPSAHIPGTLTAAGTVAAFGTVYAAHALYGFIGAGAAFPILGLIGIGAMLAGALHGPALAGLGLLGAVAAPVLVGSDAPHPWFATAYLLVVVASAYGLARLRGWRWLAVSAAVGAVAWCAPLADAGPGRGIEPVHVHLLLQTLLAIVLLSGRDAAPDRRADRLASGILAGLSGAACLVLLSEPRFAFAAAEGAVLAGAALWRPTLAPAAVLAALVLGAALCGWPPLPDAPSWDIESFPRLPAAADPGRFAAAVAVSAAALFAVGFAGAWRPGRIGAGAAAFFAGAGTAGPLLVLTLGFLRMTDFTASPPFAVAAATLALAFVASCEALERRAVPGRGLATVIGIESAAASAIAALALGLTFALSHGTLTVSFALAAAGSAFVTTRRPYGALRGAVAVLAALVLARIALDPTVTGRDLGSWPVVNWLLWGYGVPALAFALAALLLAVRRPADPVASLARGVSLLLAALLVVFELRHAINGGDVLRARLGVLEAGLQATASMGFAVATSRADRKRADPVLRGAGLLFGYGSLAFAAVALGLVCNPALTGEPVSGGPVFNDLLPAYLVPAVMAAILARHGRAAGRPSALVLTGGAVAVWLGFLYATLEVRRLFQGPDLDVFLHGAGDAESWAYSAVWLLLGSGALLYGLWQHSLAARAASAVLILGSTAKVFLIDMAGATGIWRALSFIALGGVLIGIGMLYQRVLRRPAGA